MSDRLKLLIVEDDRLMQIIYAKFTSEDIFERRFVDNGEDALTIYSDWKPDIILLDQMLPTMTGYVMLKKIRVELNDQETVIIMLSSMSKKDDILECLKLGIQGYIIKPMSDYSLLQDRLLEYYGKVHRDRVKDIMREVYLKWSNAEKAKQAGEAPAPEAAAGEGGSPEVQEKPAGQG